MTGRYKGCSGRAGAGRDWLKGGQERMQGTTCEASKSMKGKEGGILGITAMICLNVTFGGSCTMLLLASGAQPRLCPPAHGFRSPVPALGPGSTLEESPFTLILLCSVLDVRYSLRRGTPSCLAGMKYHRLKQPIPALQWVGSFSENG